MSTSESKKTKRRKIKNAVTKSSASSNVSISNANGLPQTASQNQRLEDEEKLEELMKTNDDLDLNSLPSSIFHRGPNPFMKEQCLLCGCERIDPPEAEKLKLESDESMYTETDPHAVTKLPLWVCAPCRKAADAELLDKKDSDIPFLDQDLQPEAIPFPFLSDITLDSNEPFSPNGTICNCEACKERRQIADEYNKETQELQKSWVELRQIVQILYQSDDPHLSEAERIQMTDLIVKLCSRDPHQLFLRLESQVRDLVLEKKVRLIQQLNKGWATLPESQQFIYKLLEEYGQLCRAARVTSECLADLKDHLKTFNVTWDLHNKHLFQNIVYSHPAIHHNLPVIRDTLRRGVAAQDNGDESYPNLLCRFLKYQDEMSVILVVWRDCQLLIENYNEEQTALKVKQKWLKEDWAFFKAQRKLLEQQVLKNPTATQNTHNMEAQFTETMRNLLQGTRPSVEECHCPRCNRKRCPCDECTITHMITCGIINPDALETNSTTHTFNFPHDPNFPPDSSNYFLDVHPPSVSSSNCSSGSVSPILVDPERLIQPFGDCLEDFENSEDIPEEIVDDSQSDDSDDELEDDEDDDEDEDDEEEEDDDVSYAFDTVKPKYEESKTSSTHSDLHTWMTETTSANCDCHHCVGPKTEQMFQDPYPCQCNLCLQQPSGHLLNTPLPQHVPLASRPTDLHIYPHIHGYPGLHGLQGRNHVRSILQPQLYDLHNPHQAKLPGKIDFDNPGSLQEHLYPAFGDWDNDPHGYLGSHQYGGSFPSDLLPPPPLTASNPFINDPSLISTQQTTESTISAFRTVGHSHVPNQNIICNSSHDVDQFESCAKSSTSCSVANSQVTNKISGPPCTRPITLGGNTTSQTACVEKGHSQHCLKHNHHLDKSIANSRGHGKPSVHNQHSGSDVVQNNIQNGGSNGTLSGNVKHGGKEDVAGKLRMSHPNTGSSSVPHSCSHGNKVHKQVNSAHSTCAEGHQMTCQNSVSLPTSINNVSVGTSTLCTYPDCEGNHDDNCDSIDDTCSDKSSSASSNQKEGKYCDCCYCEFFGHGNQPVSQTTKKYSEMKEKLRRRLKHRSETRPEDGTCYQHEYHHLTKHGDEKSDHKGLEELINFINGVEIKSKPSVKKQRQKQRKADEKAKQEEIEERKRRKAERKLRKRSQTVLSSVNPAYMERTESFDSLDLSNKKQTKKVSKASCDETTHNMNTPAPNSAIQSVACVTEQGTAKGKGSRLKDDPCRKSMSSPTTPIKEVKEAKPSRPQTPKQQSVNNQQKKSKQENRLSKNDSRESPTPDTLTKTTPIRNNVPFSDHTQKPVQSTTKHSNSNKNQIDVDKLSINNNNPKSGQSNKTSIISDSVIDQSQSKSSPRDNKSTGSTNDKIGKKDTPSNKQTVQSLSSRTTHPATVKATSNFTVTSSNKPNSTTSPSVKQTSISSNKPVLNSTQTNKQILNSSTKQILTQTPVNQQITTASPTNKQIISSKTKASIITSTESSSLKLTQNQKSKKKDSKMTANGIIPTMNGDISAAQKTHLNSVSANGSVVTDKVVEPVKSGKNKNKKKKKKGKSEELDEIFLPRSESDMENGELDDMEKEIEDFKRFCLDSPQPPVREKMQVNINLKDILTKKKLGLGCS